MKTENRKIQHDSKNNRRISIEKYNQELRKAEKEVAAGKYVTHDQLKIKLKSW